MAYFFLKVSYGISTLQVLSLLLFSWKNAVVSTVKTLDTVHTPENHNTLCPFGICSINDVHSSSWLSKNSDYNFKPLTFHIFKGETHALICPWWYFIFNWHVHLSVFDFIHSWYGNFFHCSSFIDDKEIFTIVLICCTHILVTTLIKLF